MKLTYHTKGGRIMDLRTKSIIPIVMLISLCTGAHAAILTVGHGSSFDHTSITDALANADQGDTILVADGYYVANDPNYPETFPLIMKEGVILVRESSGILPVIDAQSTQRVFFCESITPDSGTRIEGFKITGGNIDTSERSDRGGGIYLDNASPTIASCLITGNKAESSGGGVSGSGSSPILIDCTISHNSATVGGGVEFIGGGVPVLTNCLIFSNSTGLDGGGITVSNCSPEMRNCIVDSNRAFSDGGGMDIYNAAIRMTGCSITNNECDGSCSGAGIYLSGDCYPELSNCLIENNTGAYFGGGIQSTSTSLVLQSCVFRSNSATKGAGLSLYLSPSTVIDCLFVGNTVTGTGGGLNIVDSDPMLIHVRISQNSADGGGGIYMDHSEAHIVNCLLDTNFSGELGGGMTCVDSSPVLINCTITGNTAWDGGGAVYSYQSSPVITNSILWGNTIGGISANTGTPDVTFCNVQEGWSGEGNIDIDPLFVSGPSGEYCLSQTASGQLQTSLCVDSGSDAAENITFMIGGTTFSMADFSSRTDRKTDTGTVDMGSHYSVVSNTCSELGCRIEMPSNDFGEGDHCYCYTIICNPGSTTYTDIPVFVILDIYGAYYFAPDFSDFNYYLTDIEPGEQLLEILPGFSWPAEAGLAIGINWYAAMTDPAITDLFGTVGFFMFGWH
jgi:Protein of unknown function (DUF1565)